MTTFYDETATASGEYPVKVGSKPVSHPPVEDGYAAMGAEWMEQRIKDDDKLHKDLMELASKLGLFQRGQTMNGYNAFERIKQNFEKPVADSAEEMLDAYTHVVAADAMDCGHKVSRNALLVTGGHLTVEEADLKNAMLIENFAEDRAANILNFVGDIRKEVVSLKQEYGGVLAGRIVTMIDAVLAQQKAADHEQR